VRDQEQDLFSHLAELRTRLLRCIVAVTLGMIVMWNLRDRLLQFFAEPIVRALREHGGIPTTTSPAEGFSIYMQTVFTAVAADRVALLCCGRCGLLSNRL
jgi:sec-independent protein translocase protein TatC